MIQNSMHKGANDSENAGTVVAAHVRKDSKLLLNYSPGVRSEKIPDKVH
jgi:hypothetical protein